MVTLKSISKTSTLEQSEEISFRKDVVSFLKIGSTVIFTTNFYDLENSTTCSSDILMKHFSILSHFSVI